MSPLLLSVGWLCAVLGPKGRRRAYSEFLICKKIKATKVEKYSYSEYYFLYWVTVKICLNGLDPDLDRDKHGKIGKIYTFLTCGQ
jgi:hypothetical protein